MANPSFEIRELYCVSKTVFPWTNPALEYFALRGLADEVADFYVRYQQYVQVPGGVNIGVDPVKVKVLTDSEGRMKLAYNGPYGDAVWQVQTTFNLQERVDDFKFLKELAQMAIENSNKQNGATP